MLRGFFKTDWPGHGALASPNLIIVIFFYAFPPYICKV